MAIATVWIPTLKRNAPSNAAGMAGAGSACYRTRRGALNHEHYNNHAAYARARKVVVVDGSLSADAEGILQGIANANDLYSEFDPRYAEAEKLRREGRCAEAVLKIVR